MVVSSLKVDEVLLDDARVAIELMVLLVGLVVFETLIESESVLSVVTSTAEFADSPFIVNGF